MIWKRFFSITIILSLILGSWKGYIALFEKGSSEPWQVFPYSVSSLPPADQAALDTGIPIRNQRDLQKVIEDYLS